MSDDRLHAILSILDAGSRGQWPSKEWSETGGDEIVKRGYEAVLEIYNRRPRDATETAAIRKVRDAVQKSLGLLPSGWNYCGVCGLSPKEIVAALDAILKERE